MKFGVETTRKILDRLSSPDKKLKIIHIAGTNGKGSTAEFFTQILIAAGKKTGTFTSPAIYSYNGQFRINGKPLSEDKAVKYFSDAVKAAAGLNATSFEIETAGCIYAFYRENCEFAVLECGMGGLSDATNAVCGKSLAVITSIALEHTAYLGNSPVEICSQKAGIIKDCPAVVNAYQPAGVLNFFKGTGAVIADKFDKTDGRNFTYGGKDYALGTYGCLQPYNAATAIEGAALLGIDGESIKKGVENARTEGRIEVIRADKIYILDGAHNPAAFEPLKNFLKGEKSERTLVYGCLKDKDTDGNLQALEGLFGEAIAVECDSFRKSGLEETVCALNRHFKDVKAAKSIEEAVNSAHYGEVVVCGSFTLLKRAKDAISKRRKR